MGYYICDRFQLSETGYAADIAVHFGRAWYWSTPDENTRGVISVHLTLDVMGKARNKAFDDVLYGTPNDLASWLYITPETDDVKLNYMSGNKCRREMHILFNGGRLNDRDLETEVRTEEAQYRYGVPLKKKIIPMDESHAITVYHDNGLFTRKAIDDIRRWFVYQLYDLLNEAHIIQER